MNITELSPETAALNRAIKHHGGIAAMARALELNGGAVIQQWRINRVPAERCPEIERITNGLVRCEDLRPDVRWDVLRMQAAAPAARELATTTEPAAAGGF